MKKQLLNETEIRKMMKFANIGPLSTGFVDRLSESTMVEADGIDDEEEDDDDLEGGMSSPEGDMSLDPDDVSGADDEMSMMDPDAGGEPGGEPGGDAVAQALTAVGDMMAKAQEAFRFLGPDGETIANAISVEQGPEDDAGLEGGMTSPDADMSMDPDADAPLPDVDVVDDEEDEEALGAPDAAALEEVARRVAKRLRRMNKKSRF